MTTNATHTDHAPHYQSNPLDLIRPSYDGVNSNMKPYLLLIAAAFGVFIGLVIGIVAVAALFSFNQVAGVLAGIVFGVAALMFAIAIGPIPYKLTLAMAHKKPLTFTEVINSPFSLAWKMFYTQLLAVLIIIGGFILLIVPGIIFSVWYAWVPYVVFEEGLTGWAALKRSKQLVQNRFWDAFGTTQFFNAIGIVTIVPFLGGLAYLAAAFLLAPMPAVRYLQLKALKAHSDGRDVKTHPWNYGIIALSIVASSISFNMSWNDMQKSMNENNASDTPYYLETN